MQMFNFMLFGYKQQVLDNLKALPHDGGTGKVIGSKIHPRGS